MTNDRDTYKCEKTIMHIMTLLFGNKHICN